MASSGIAICRLGPSLGDHRQCHSRPLGLAGRLCLVGSIPVRRLLLLFKLARWEEIVPQIMTGWCALLRDCPQSSGRVLTLLASSSHRGIQARLLVTHVQAIRKTTVSRALRLRLGRR